MRRVALAMALAACGGGGARPGTGAAAPIEAHGPPAPASCPGVVYACTDPAVGCFEGGVDFKDAMASECKKVGGTESGHCDPAGTLGSCTVFGQILPAFHGCGTMWVRPGQVLQAPDDGKAKCAKIGGTWTTTP